MKLKSVAAATFAIALCLANVVSAQNQKSPAKAATAIYPTVTEMFDYSATGTKTNYPWHYKAESGTWFRPATQIEKFNAEGYARRSFDWQTISSRLTDKRGFYPNFRIYLGVSSDGKLEGVVFGNAFSAINSAAAAAKQLGTFESIGLAVIGAGELVNMPLGPVQSVPIPGETHKIWFRKFSASNKAYRMLGALPDESKVRFYHVAAGEQGSINYWKGKRAITTAFTIGYLKEMIGAVRQGMQNK